MSNNYAPGYPVNTNPGPVGDTVKTAVDKHIAEFLKAYADISALYQQILVELRYADVDMVDGKHADNTANNIPVLNSSGELTSDVNNTNVTTAELIVNGTAAINELNVKELIVRGNSSAETLKDTGYVKFTNGLILQWGFTGTITGQGAYTVTFSIPFPSSCWHVYLSIKNPTIGNDDMFPRVLNINSTGAELYAEAASSALHGTRVISYLAIGM